ELLGHTDERSTRLILDRAKRLLSEISESARMENEKRIEKLKVKFLDPLPENHRDWLKVVPDYIQEQFLDYMERVIRIKARRKLVIGPAKKSKLVGRNDPCPCGSGKKYKKCHIDKIIE